MIAFRVASLAFMLLTTVHSAEKPGGRIEAFLDSIVVPAVRFDDDSLEATVDYARVRSVELDTYPDEQVRGISIRIKYPEGKPAPRPKVTLNADKIRLSDLLRRIAEQAGMDVHITSVGVVMCFTDDSPFPMDGIKEGEVYRTIHRAKQPKEPKPESEQDSGGDP